MSETEDPTPTAMNPVLSFSGITPVMSGKPGGVAALVSPGTKLDPFQYVHALVSRDSPTGTRATFMPYQVSVT